MTTCERYERLNPSQLAAAVRKRPIAWLPLGPLEWHGEAIAFGCDPMNATAVVEKAWRKTGGVLLPTLFAGIGSVDKHGRLAGHLEQFALHAAAGQDWPGSVYSRPFSFELLIQDILFFLECAGFRLCILHSGHGDGWHNAAIERIEDRWRGRPMKVVYWAHYAKSLKPFPKAWTREIDSTGVPWTVPSGHHGDFNEASLVGAIDPRLVDKRRFGRHKRDRACGIKPENAPFIDFAKGKKILEFDARRMAAAVNSLYQALPKEAAPDLRSHLRNRVRIFKGARPLNPPVGAWKRSPPMPGVLARAPFRKPSRKAGWQDTPASRYYFADGAAGWEIPLREVAGKPDGLVYIGNRFTVAKGGQWAILLGYEGNVKVFVDGKAVFYEPRRHDPSKPLVRCYRFHRRAYRSLIFVTLDPGLHEVTIALDARQGIGSGLTFRFLPTAALSEMLEAWEQL